MKDNRCRDLIVKHYIELLNEADSIIARLLKYLDQSSAMEMEEVETGKKVVVEDWFNLVCAREDHELYDDLFSYNSGRATSKRWINEETI